MPLTGNCSSDYPFHLENTQVLGSVLPTFVLSPPYGQRRYCLISCVSDDFPLSQERFLFEFAEEKKEVAFLSCFVFTK